jgi:hypothetical protein
LAHLKAHPHPDLDRFGRDALDPAHHAETFVEVDEDDVAGIAIPAVHGCGRVDGSPARALAPVERSTAANRTKHARIEDCGRAIGAALIAELPILEMSPVDEGWSLR